MQSKSERLNTIQNLLLEHPEGLSVSEIAKELGITSATVHRDLISLEESSLLLWENKIGRIGIFPPTDTGVDELAKLGENNRLEFKQTACWNPHKKVKDQSLVENIVKSIAAFMNSKTGGILLIGIANDGQIIGLDDDFAHADISKPNKDGYELFLRNIINDSIGASAIPYYEIEFVISQSGKDVCKIKIRPASHPVYFKGAFFLRNGNQSKLLTTQDAIRYITERWPGS